MIYFYTGTPGSGKSLHMASEIYEAMYKGKNVIANFEINESYFEKAKHLHIYFFYASSFPMIRSNTTFLIMTNR